MTWSEIHATGAPSPHELGGYPVSQGASAGGFIFVSGQVGMKQNEVARIEGTIADETRACLRHIEAVLSAAGASLSDVVKVQVLLADMTDFAEVNAVYRDFFNAPFPARTAFGVGELALDFRVEIEAIAYRGSH